MLRALRPRLPVEESPGSKDQRWRLTAAGGDPRESATEMKPPAQGQLCVARVKRCGKSAPRLRQRRRHGKPHREQDRIGAARMLGATPASSAILAAARVGCSRHGAIPAPEEWPSRRYPLQTEPGLQAGWQICPWRGRLEQDRFGRITLPQSGRGGRSVNPALHHRLESKISRSMIEEKRFDQKRSCSRLGRRRVRPGSASGDWPRRTSPRHGRDRGFRRLPAPAHAMMPRRRRPWPWGRA